MTLTKDQIAMRRSGIGASEIPAILGMDEGRTAFKVWLEKQPGYEPKDSTPEQDRGHFAEDMIAKMYERDHPGCAAQSWQETVKHPEHDWLFCTPDYRVWLERPLECVLEVKTTAKFLNEDQCPDAYEAQARTQLAVLADRGIKYVDIAALNGHGFVLGTPCYWTIERDEAIEKSIIEIARDFWFDYVVAKKEPPPDASEEYAKYCNLQPSQGKVLTIDENHPLFTVIEVYRAKKEALKDAEQDADLVANELRHAMIELDCVKHPQGSMYYTSTKAGSKTEWETIARRFMGMIVAPDGDGTAARDLKPKQDLIKLCESIIAQHTTPKPSYRRLNPKWSR